ncbi:MAG: S-layer family protein [Leptolyngbyaceae cyanobacterium SU_3_3]|nr:S-layer family protein [Leptolyngbyaceae cyanobacterium SU_3_3]
MGAAQPAAIVNRGRLSVGQDLNLSGGIVTSLGELSASNGQLSLTAIAQMQVGVAIAQNITLISQGNLTSTDGLIKTHSATEQIGNISITARSINLDNTKISSDTYGSLHGSNILLNAGSLVMLNGAQITSRTFGVGNAGNIEIEADTIDLIGMGANALNAAILTRAESGSVGLGGNVTIRSRFLNLTNGAAVNTQSEGMGNAGNIHIITQAFEAKNGGQLRTRTAGSGRSGNIDLTATEHVHLIGTGTFEPLAAAIVTAIVRGRAISFQPPIDRADGDRIAISTPNGLLQTTAQQVANLGNQETGLFASTAASATGAGGNIRIETPQLQANRQAIISVSNWGNGSGGTLKIDANNIVMNRALAIASTLEGKGGTIRINANNIKLDFSLLIATTASDEGANVQLTVKDVLLMRRGSQITARGYDFGNGGNIDIQAGSVVALPTENSDISANTSQGRGGTIRLRARSILGLDSRFSLTDRSDIAANSDLGTNGDVTIDTSNADPNQGVFELPAGIMDTTREMVQTCTSQANSFVVSGRGGLPPIPTEVLSGSVGWIDWRGITPAQRQPLPPQTHHSAPWVEATGWRVEPDGTIALVANGVSTSQPSVSCQTAQSLDGQ